MKSFLIDDETGDNGADSKFYCNVSLFKILWYLNRVHSPMPVILALGKWRQGDPASSIE